MFPSDSDWGRNNFERSRSVLFYFVLIIFISHMITLEALEYFFLILSPTHIDIFVLTQQTGQVVSCHYYLIKLAFGENIFEL